MRSSIYRTMGRFSQRSSTKFVSDQVIDDVAIYSDQSDTISYEQTQSNPKRISYITPANNYGQKPVTVLSYNNPVRHNHAKSNPLYNDLASSIQKQRF